MLTKSERNAAAMLQGAGFSFWASAPDPGHVWAVKSGSYWLVKIPSARQSKLVAWRGSKHLEGPDESHEVGADDVPVKPVRVSLRLSAAEKLASDAAKAVDLEFWVLAPSGAAAWAVDGVGGWWFITFGSRTSVREVRAYRSNREGAHGVVHNRLATLVT